MKFTVHESHGCIKVTPKGGNSYAKKNDILEWNSSPQDKFKLTFHDLLANTTLAWSDVFSTTEPSWPTDATGAQTLKQGAPSPLKYDVTVGNNTLDPVIIIGGGRESLHGGGGLPKPLTLLLIGAVIGFFAAYLLL